MKIKIIGAILCVVMMSLCTITVNAEENIHKDKFQIIDAIKTINNIVNKTTENDEHFTQIVGPASKFYTSVEVEGGLSIQTLLIKRNANRRLLRASMFLPFILIPVENLSFNITFKKDVDNTSRFIFNTFYGDLVYDEGGNITGIENESEIINQAHTVEVKNFSGFFVFKRARVRKLVIIKNIISRLLPFIPDIFDVLPDTHRFMHPARIGFAGFYEEISVSI